MNKIFLLALLLALPAYAPAHASAMDELEAWNDDSQAAVAAPSEEEAAHEASETVDTYHNDDGN